MHTFSKLLCLVSRTVTFLVPLQRTREHIMRGAGPIYEKDPESRRRTCTFPAPRRERRHRPRGHHIRHIRDGGFNEVKISHAPYHPLYHSNRRGCRSGEELYQSTERIRSHGGAIVSFRPRGGRTGITHEVVTSVTLAMTDSMRLRHFQSFSQRTS